jgi:hypothetical protein
MNVFYHVFERSDFSDDPHRPTCAVCGNPESAATGTGHVATEGEAARRNGEQHCRNHGHQWNKAGSDHAQRCANGCGTTRWLYPDNTVRRYSYPLGYVKVTKK